MIGKAAEASAATKNMPLGELEVRLGHRFSRPELLERALTHASMTVKLPNRRRGGKDAGQGQAISNNERLEFLGDRVLGLAIAHALIELYPNDAEGRLTDRLVALVKRDALVEVATSIELGHWLKLAAGEESTGGRSNPGILADCLEALIGAIYIDGGLVPAENFVRQHWHQQLRAMREPPRDPKMALQEWAHANTGSLPKYEIIDRTGPAHAPTFNVAVEVGRNGRETASASSKRAAEQAAAALLLQRLETS